VTRYLPRSVDDAIRWSLNQSKHPSKSWKGLCQSHCRNAYGVPAWSDSAIHAWGRIPASKKHAGGNPNDAPRGALLYYSGGRFGHVALATGVTNKRCLSNDYVRQGHIDYAPRTFPRWGLHYVGYSFWTPYGEMRPA
jgi:hypothetical protein